MNLTERTQVLISQNMSLEDALPTRMPVYVNSMANLFGATALSALVVIILRGLIIAVFGPAWYHSSALGHFVNSLHFWGVQAFFAALVLHFGTKYLTLAWRDGRWKPGWSAWRRLARLYSLGSPASCRRPTGTRNGSPCSRRTR